MYQILLGLEKYEYYQETVNLPNPGGVLTPMTWGWNVDEELGQKRVKRGFANGETC